MPLTPDTHVRNQESSMDSLSGFVVFNRVAETRSFVAAGQSLGISASAVGKRVARLESRLGVRLFHRSTRSITLTAEGTLFLERSRRILAEIEATEQALSQASVSPRGRLRVSMPQVTALVMPALAEFMALYPQVELDLDFSDRMVDIVGEGFDVVMRGGQPVDSRSTPNSWGTSSTAWWPRPGTCTNAAHPCTRATWPRIPACIIASRAMASWKPGRCARSTPNKPTTSPSRWFATMSRHASALP